MVKKLSEGAGCPNCEILGNLPNDENEGDVSASFHVWNLIDYSGSLGKT